MERHQAKPGVEEWSETAAATEQRREPRTRGGSRMDPPAPDRTTGLEPATFIRQRATGPFWYGKWSRNSERVIRALGRA